MERYYIKDGDLFKKGDTNQLEYLLKQEVSKRIQSLKDDYVLNVSEIEYVNYLTEEMRIECPEVQFENCSVETRRVLMPNEYLPMFIKFSCHEDLERTVYRLCIPLSGDKEVLRYLPSQFLLSGSGHFCFDHNEIYVDIPDVNGNGENVAREIKTYKDDLIKMIGFLKTDIERINKSICLYIPQVFKARKEKVLKEQKIIADLGIPIKSKTSTSKTYSVPTVTRRIKEPLAINSQIAKPLVPTMAETVYQEILKVINTTGKSIERYPKTIENQDEETIRAHFLTQLSSSFKSFSSTGESFNHKGKTDIMIKHGNDVLFVAECKIWKGAKMLNEAINQLLGYLTWRDSKTALLIFNKDTAIQTVIQSIQESIPNHSNFVKQIGQRDKGWFDYSFHLTDSSDEIKMAVMVFDFR
ncbi:MAG: hypothetical protein IKH44_14655 [Bacteroidales bacterium]|nr:hypothetical protein [Bacteroidales bacterium]